MVSALGEFFGGLGLACSTLLVHGVQQASRELVRVFLPTFPERFGYRPKILDERARRDDPSLARQRAAHVLAHLVYRAERTAAAAVASFGPETPVLAVQAERG